MAERRHVITSEESHKREQPGAAELLYNVTQIEQNDLPYIRLWPKEQGIAPSEQEERTRVVKEIERHLRLLSDAVARMQERTITLADVIKDPRFKKAEQTLKDLLQRSDLFAYLESKKHSLLETNEGGESTLLPSADFDPSTYSEQEITIATDVLAQSIDEISVGAHLDAAKETVVSFLRSHDFNSYIREHAAEPDASVNDRYSLVWIKSHEPKVWQALCTLVQGKREVLYAILGDTPEYNGNGVISLDKDKTDRTKAMRDNMANALNIALYASGNAVASDALPGTYRQAEKETLTELYGTLPPELDYEAEDLLVRVEVQKVIESIAHTLTEKEQKQLADGLVLLKSRNPFGKIKRVIAHEHWPEFAAAVTKALQSDDEKVLEKLKHDLAFTTVSVVDQVVAKTDTLSKKAEKLVEGLPKSEVDQTLWRSMLSESNRICQETYTAGRQAHTLLRLLNQESGEIFLDQIGSLRVQRSGDPKSYQLYKLNDANKNYVHATNWARKHLALKDRIRDTEWLYDFRKWSFGTGYKNVVSIFRSLKKPVDLTNLYLRGADFSGGTFRNVDLSKSDITGSVWGNMGTMYDVTPPTRTEYLSQEATRENMLPAYVLYTFQKCLQNSNLQM